MTETELAWSAEKFAKSFGISRAQVYKAMSRGEIPHLNFGLRKVIPKWYVDHLCAKPTESQISGEGLHDSTNP